MRAMTRLSTAAIAAAAVLSATAASASAFGPRPGHGIRSDHHGVQPRLQAPGFAPARP
jgi:hypothetical protein